jgi:hypothetical protein
MQFEFKLNVNNEEVYLFSWMFIDLMLQLLIDIFKGFYYMHQLSDHFWSPNLVDWGFLARVTESITQAVGLIFGWDCGLLTRAFIASSAGALTWISSKLF